MFPTSDLAVVHTPTRTKRTPRWCAVGLPLLFTPLQCELGSAAFLIELLRLLLDLGQADAIAELLTLAG